MGETTTTTTVEKGATQVEVMPEPMPGWKSTEAQLVVLVTMILSSGLVPQNVLPIIAGLAGLYVACRTILKAVHVMGYAKAIPDLPELPQIKLPVAAPGSTTTTVTTVPK